MYLCVKQISSQTSALSYTVHAMRVQAQVGGGGGTQVLTLAVLV
jgi:hypothetical protein